MSNKRNIKAPKSKENKKQQYPASIPANFWSARKPPSAPVIKPLPWNDKNNILPKIKDLPPVNKDTHGMDQARTGGQGGSFSLNSNRHPMSLPVKSAGFVIGPNYGKPSKFVNNNNNNDNNNENDNKNNDDMDASSFKKSKGKLKIGSYTIMSIIGGPLKGIPDNENEYNKNEGKNVDTLMTNLELNNNNNNDNNNNNNTNNDTNNELDKDGDDDLLHGGLDDDEEDESDDNDDDD